MGRKQPPRGWAWWDNVVHKRSKDDELIGRWMPRRKVKLNGFPDEKDTSMTDHEVDHEIQIIREAIVALIHSRDFLGYQLSHANGGMDDAQLDEIATEYLVERHYTDEDLHTRLVVLKQLVGERLDVEAAATMLQCGVEQVLKAWPKEAKEVVRVKVDSTDSEEPTWVNLNY